MVGMQQVSPLVLKLPPYVSVEEFNAVGTFIAFR